MYVERRARGELAEVAQCTWQSLCERAETTRIVPDACTDIIWDGRSLFVAGPDTGPVLHPNTPGDLHVAVRLATGKNGVLGVPANALRDARAPLGELWGDAARTLEDELAAARDAEAASAVLERAVGQQLTAAAPPDRLVQQLVWIIRTELEAPPSVRALAATLGVTERQLLRRCNAALGYGPKLLARIFRFQHFLTYVRSAPEKSLAEIAQICGYADQAHLAHETAEFAGVQPRVLREEQGSRGMSEFDKPEAAVRQQASGHGNHRQRRSLAV